MSKYKHTDEFGAPVFKPDLHDKARANKDDNDLREQVAQAVLELILQAVKSGGYRDADYILDRTDELITLIRTATLDEVVALFDTMEGEDIYRFIKAIDNLRGSDD